MTEAQFAALCKAHDLTYYMSDDFRVYDKGRASFHAILIAAGPLPRDVTARIWNAAVDAKIADPEFRKQFYWLA